MRAVVVYESMYGNTHAVAQAIADGLGSKGQATVFPVSQATTEELSWVDLVVVGGPTHAHGMSQGIDRALRHNGCDVVAKPESFYVDRENHLLPVEDERARAWGRSLAEGLGR